jgi:signal transduction protein with GAF and PtsI domain
VLRVEVERLNIAAGVESARADKAEAELERLKIALEDANDQVDLYKQRIQQLYASSNAKGE